MTSKLKVPRISLIISAVLLFLIYYTSRSIHELNHMQDIHIRKYHADLDIEHKAEYVEARRPVVWYYTTKKKTTFLNHVYEVFGRIGYLSGGSHNQWDVLWAHDYPFEALADELANMSPHQKVNHFPGIGFMTLKSSLVKMKKAFVPKAFQIPSNKTSFLKYASRHPNTLWVQKGINHRQIKIITPKDADLNNDGLFIQEFIANPYLIDNRKFDIGVYTVITSMDPLRIYVFNQEILIRFCDQDYNPFDPLNTNKYVISDDYTGIWEIPSLKDTYNTHSFNRKDTMTYYMKQNGHDFGQVMNDMYDQIVSVVTEKEPELLTVIKKKKYNIRNFFELMRFDFIIDESLRVWLMEVNMSPNLSSGHTPPNRMMYKQVLFNALNLVGVARTMPTSRHYSTDEEKDIEVSDQDIQVNPERCGSDICLRCQSPQCQLCHKCMSSDWKVTLKMATREHISRRQMTRIYPAPMTRDNAMEHSVLDDPTLSESNSLMHEWFRTKCLHDYVWCL